MKEGISAEGSAVAFFCAAAKGSFEPLAGWKHQLTLREEFCYGELVEYVIPEPLTEDEVIARIDSATRDEDVIDVALSAIYYCETQFAGDILLKAYQKISGNNRLFLGNITETFVRVHETAYRIDDFVEEMRKDGPDPIAMEENIESIIEFARLFSTVH